MCGRNLCYQNRLLPTQHVIRQIHQQSLLIQLIICHSHRLIGCGQGTQAYLDHVRLSGFNSVNLEPMVAKFKDNDKFGWPTAILFLAPAEGWKGPAGDLWPHLK